MGLSGKQSSIAVAVGSSAWEQMRLYAKQRLKSCTHSWRSETATRTPTYRLARPQRHGASGHPLSGIGVRPKRSLSRCRDLQIHDHRRLKRTPNPWIVRGPQPGAVRIVVYVCLRVWEVGLILIPRVVYVCLRVWEVGLILIPRLLGLIGHGTVKQMLPFYEGFTLCAWPQTLAAIEATFTGVLTYACRAGS